MTFQWKKDRTPAPDISQSVGHNPVAFVKTLFGKNEFN